MPFLIRQDSMLWSLALRLLYHTFADARSFRSEELKLFCRFLTLVVVNFSLGALAVLVERLPELLLVPEDLPLDLLLEPRPNFLARVSLSNSPLSNICFSMASARLTLSSVIKPSESADWILVLDSL